MSRLLHISASPRGECSESLAIAGTFLQVLSDEHPEIEVDTWDLWDGTLPAFGAEAAAGKYAIFSGTQHTSQQAAAWAAVRATFERFVAADYYLFTVPMWNHGIPYVLKQFIDVVSQPGLVYGFDPETGYVGLVTGKKAVVIYTSGVYGDDRGESFGIDFQRPYFDDWLRRAGIVETEAVMFRPNLAVADPEPGRRAAQAAAAETARRLPVDDIRKAS
jgi:FMN-dependent NADH-azoreductase